jgi:outer membrane protein assembly factor BamB
MWCKMRGRRFQVVAGLLLAPAMMAGLALTAGPAHAQYPVSGGARARPAMMAGLALTAGPAHAQYPVSGGARDSAHASQPAKYRRAKVTYVVRAFITGHNKLTLAGRKARWYNVDGEAPVRYPTFINGVRWRPSWPSPAGYYDCKCYSSTFRKVKPRVPKKAVISSFKKVACRDICSARFSHDALVVDFKDDAGGAGYKVRVTLSFEQRVPRIPARPLIKISHNSGPPGSSVTISGAGFGAHQAVDLYFDTSDKALVRANGRGAFSDRAFDVPSSALPGIHYLTAVQRHTARSAQAKFVVNTNWIQDSFSRSHTGFNPYENVLSPSNVGRLQLDWSGHLARFQKTDIAPSPAVVDGVVYMSSTRSQDRPSRVYAFSAATGKKLWSFRGGSGNIGGAPTVVNGTVYTNAGSDSLYALSAATGKLKWSYLTRGSVEWSPSVAYGKVYFCSDFGGVFAVSASVGAAVGQFSDGGACSSAPTVVGGAVYTGSGDGTVYGGSWSHFIGAAIAYSDVVVVDGTVYVATSAGEVYALGARHGHKLWSFDAGAGIASPIAVANGVIYIDTSGPDGAVEAVSAATRQELWSFASGGSNSASPTVANGVVYVGSSDDDVYALDAATGAELWSFRTGGSVESSPAVVNGRVYVGSDDGRIYAFGLPGGQPAEARPRPSSLQPNYSLREQA